MKFKEPFNLARKPSGNDVNAPTSPYSEEEGIVVHLPDLAGLPCLPASGEITFRFYRKNLNLQGAGDEASLSGAICLESILGIKCDEPAEGEKTDDKIDALFEEAKKAESEEKSGD